MSDLPNPAKAAALSQTAGGGVYGLLKAIRYNAENGSQDRPLHDRLRMIARDANEAIGRMDRAMLASAPAASGGESAASVSERARTASMKEIVPAEKRNYLDDNGNPRSIEDEAYAHGWNACRAATLEKLALTTPSDAGGDREDEDYHVIMSMGRLLAAIALSVKGPEPAGTAWSYHDLPDIVAALQEAAEQVADEMTAWAATKMADRGSSRRDRMMISEWAKRLRNPGTFPAKDFEVEGTTLTKEEMRAIVRKVLATPPAPQRLAQGERPSNCRMALRDAGKAYPRSGCAACGDGGLRGCPYERTAQPPHQDRGEVEQQTVAALVDRIDWWADKYEAEGGHAVVVQLLRQYAGMVAKIPTAALTEAKQQETDGPVDATDDADYLRHVAAKLARLGYRIMGAVVEGIAIQYAAMATKQQGPGEAVYQFRDAYGAWRDTTKSHYDVETQHDKRILYTAPQVEAKRQTGGDHG